MATRPTHCIDCGAPIIQARTGKRLRCDACRHKRLRARENMRKRVRRALNPKPYRACANAHYAANSELCIERVRVYQLACRAEMLANYGNACQHCGEACLELLEVHHTLGGYCAGYPAYPSEFRCTTPLLVAAILRYVDQWGELPPDIELLCHKCHKAVDRERASHVGCHRRQRCYTN